ncbi:MAG: 5-formyltetrahydrofolate cyclo-ligase [Bacteroidales bacterium]|nr:5-formyltetrahydrofolate cyclo-ligase [Bacteroidales bacterium]
MPASLKEEKQRLRQILRERAEAFFVQTPFQQREEKAWEIFSRIEKTGAFREAKTLLLYASLPDEVPTGEALSRWGTSKRLALPLVQGDELVLKAYEPDRLRPGYQGIAEPEESCPTIAPEEIDLVIVPGRAFTQEGARLGRGKGYYDRLLPQLANARKFGVAFPFQIVESLPSDPWDERLDAVYFSS